jgi:hypothetical protein
VLLIAASLRWHFRSEPMAYAHGVPLAMANLSPSLSPKQRSLNATSVAVRRASLTGTRQLRQRAASSGEDGAPPILV